jgi:hypothetical protein
MPFVLIAAILILKMRTDGTGACDNCARTFNYVLIHNGFNDSAYAYCDDCGVTALFSWASRKIPDGVEAGSPGPITPAVEELAAACACGGRFRAGAAPRCPDCRCVLSSEKAAEYIERNAPGWAKGWRWQRNWRGLYAVVIDERLVEDPWREAGGSDT